MNADGFVDLRLNAHGEGGDDSFWPSFADIMMVTVMIFLLAMVILLVRNIELVQQIRATMEAERHASELARSTSEEKEVLIARLTETETELSMLRMHMLQLQETNVYAEEQLSEQETELGQLRAARDRMTRKAAKLDRQARSLRKRLATRNAAYDELRTQHSQLTASYDALEAAHTADSDALEELQRVNTEQAEQLSQIRARVKTAEQSLSDERGRFSELKIKYDKLVRPARTPQGKYVVEVRYAKIDNVDHIELKRPTDPAPQRVDKTDLYRILDVLKKKQPKKLYVKIIFPEDSGLSYNQAWSFTTELLKKYDYYYQDAPETPSN